MAITVVPRTQLFFSETGVTAGNEFIWPVPQGQTFVLQAIPTSAGSATPYTSNDGVMTPTDFDDLVAIVSTPHTTTFQESPFVGGQRWAGVKVGSGTWTVSITLSGRAL